MSLGKYVFRACYRPYHHVYNNCVTFASEYYRDILGYHIEDKMFSPVVRFLCHRWHWLPKTLCRILPSWTPANRLLKAGFVEVESGEDGDIVVHDDIPFFGLVYNGNIYVRTQACIEAFPLNHEVNNKTGRFFRYE